MKSGARWLLIPLLVLASGVHAQDDPRWKVVKVSDFRSYWEAEEVKIVSFAVNNTDWGTSPRYIIELDITTGGLSSRSVGATRDKTCPNVPYVSVQGPDSIEHDNDERQFFKNVSKFVEKGEEERQILDTVKLAYAKNLSVKIGVTNSTHEIATGPLREEIRNAMGNESYICSIASIKLMPNNEDSEEVEQ